MWLRSRMNQTATIRIPTTPNYYRVSTNAQAYLQLGALEKWLIALPNSPHTQEALQTVRSTRQAQGRWLMANVWPRFIAHPDDMIPDKLMVIWDVPLEKTSGEKLPQALVEELWTSSRATLSFIEAMTVLGKNEVKNMDEADLETAFPWNQAKETVRSQDGLRKRSDTQLPVLLDNMNRALRYRDSKTGRIGIDRVMPIGERPDAIFYEDLAELYRVAGLVGHRPAQEWAAAGLRQAINGGSGLVPVVFTEALTEQQVAEGLAVGMDGQRIRPQDSTTWPVSLVASIVSGQSLAAEDKETVLPAVPVQPAVSLELEARRPIQTSLADRAMHNVSMKWTVVLFGVFAAGLLLYTFIWSRIRKWFANKYQRPFARLGKVLESDMTSQGLNFKEIAPVLMEEDVLDGGFYVDAAFTGLTDGQKKALRAANKDKTLTDDKLTALEGILQEAAKSSTSKETETLILKFPSAMDQ